MDKQIKHCKKCNLDKPFSDFYHDKRAKSGCQTYCKQCLITYNLKYYPLNVEKRRAYANKWNFEHKEKRRAYARAYARTVKENGNKVKDLVYSHYGYKCSCSKCPETDPAFLTIDHINNDGCKQRKVNNHHRGFSFYRWIIKNNFPPDLQTLCMNCNWGKNRNNGICPHLI